MWSTRLARAPGIPCLGGGADGADVTTTRFFLKMALQRKEEEEEQAKEEERMRALNDTIRRDLPLTVAEKEAWWKWICVAPSSSSSGKEEEEEEEEEERLLLVLLIAKVGDVPVLFSDKFQQSNVLPVPLVQSIYDFWTGAWFDGAENCGRSAVAVHRWPSTSLSCCRGSSPKSRLFSRSSRLPRDSQLQFVARWSTFMCRKLRQFQQLQLTNKGFYIPVVAQWLSPMVQTVLRTIQIPQLLVDKVVAAPVKQVAGLSGHQHPCRGAEADPHGLADQRDSPVARGHVVDALILQVVPVARVSQVLVVKITVVIPQFQHIEKTCVDKVVHTPFVCNDKSSTSLS